MRCPGALVAAFMVTLIPSALARDGRGPRESDGAAKVAAKPAPATTRDALPRFGLRLPDGRIELFVLDRREPATAAPALRAPEN